MTIIRNPFITSGYVSSDYFCDREKESETLIEKHIWVTPAMLAVFLLAGWILTGQLTRWYTKERRTDKHTGRKKRSSQRNRTP